MLHDFDRLVNGAATEQTRQEEGETMEAREKNIETCFEQWHEQKEEMLKKARPKDKDRELQQAQVGGMMIRQGNAWYQRWRLLENHLKLNIPRPSESQSEIVSRPLPDASGQVSLVPEAFVLRSGILLWGQLHTIFAGSLTQGVQRNTESVPDPLPGGTTLQRVLKCRSAARNGNWRVRKAFSNTLFMLPHGSVEPTRHFGWIMYHEDTDPLEAVNRIGRIKPEGGSISNGNKHTDKNTEETKRLEKELKKLTRPWDVFFVARYDWSSATKGSITPDFPQRFKTFVQDATGATIINTDQLEDWQISDIESLITRSQGYMMAFDEAEFLPAFVASFVEGCLPSKSGEQVFDKNGGSSAFGAYVSIANTEYEFGPRLLVFCLSESTFSILVSRVHGANQRHSHASGWLLFSGNKHDQFPEEDELVAILYDGAYDCLESFKFAVEEV